MKVKKKTEFFFIVSAKFQINWFEFGNNDMYKVSLILKKSINLTWNNIEIEWNPYTSKSMMIRWYLK